MADVAVVGWVEPAIPINRDTALVLGIALLNPTYGKAI